MKINIKATNIELDDALRFWVQEKIGELEKFLGVFGPDDSFVGGREKVEAWVEIGKTTRHHLKGDVFRAEVQLYLPKKSLRAEAIDTDLRVAINTTKDELQREIKKYKNKRLSRARRSARKQKQGFQISETLKSKYSDKILRILRRKK